MTRKKGLCSHPPHTHSNTYQSGQSSGPCVDYTHEQHWSRKPCQNIRSEKRGEIIMLLLFHVWKDLAGRVGPSEAPTPSTKVAYISLGKPDKWDVLFTHWESKTSRWSQPVYRPVVWHLLSIQEQHQNWMWIGTAAGSGRGNSWFYSMVVIFKYTNKFF